MVSLLARTASVNLMMEAATRNAEAAQSLPLFRAEALSARQKIQGEALFIRPFSFRFFLVLIASLAALSLGFLVLAQFEPRTIVVGFSASTSPGAAAQQTKMKAIFNVPADLASRLRPGLLVPVRCPLCGSAGFHSGIVTSIEPLAGTYKSAPLSGPEASEPAYRITVAVTPINPPRVAIGLQQDVKLEAEFPLKRRPLIHWLFGSAAWGRF